MKKSIILLLFPLLIFILGCSTKQIIKKPNIGKRDLIEIDTNIDDGIYDYYFSPKLFINKNNPYDICIEYGVKKLKIKILKDKVNILMGGLYSCYDDKNYTRRKIDTTYKMGHFVSILSLDKLPYMYIRISGEYPIHLKAMFLYNNLSCKSALRYFKYIIAHAHIPYKTEKKIIKTLYYSCKPLYNLSKFSKLRSSLIDATLSYMKFEKPLQFTWFEMESLINKYFPLYKGQSLEDFINLVNNVEYYKYHCEDTNSAKGLEKCIISLNKIIEKYPKVSKILNVDSQLSYYKDSLARVLESPLLYAIANNDFLKVKNILNYLKKYDALHLNKYWNNYYLQNYYDITESIYGENIMSFAVRTFNIKIMKLLVSQGGVIDTPTINIALEDAFQKDSVDNVIIKFNPNITIPNPQTSLKFLNYLLNNASYNAKVYPISLSIFLSSIFHNQNLKGVVYKKLIDNLFKFAYNHYYDKNKNVYTDFRDWCRNNDIKAPMNKELYKYFAKKYCK